MKVLLLVIKTQRAIFDKFYEAIENNCDLEVLRLDDKEQENLKGFFKRINVKAYDRIVLFLRFKKLIPQLSFISTIPNLVILEHDACQNYYSASKYCGKFSRHYRGIPWARILVSGDQLSKHLRDEGFDALYVPKGYDESQLKNLQKPRDIEIGFLGSIENKTYEKRKAFLNDAQTKLGLVAMRTHSGEDYLYALNRIKFFVSADIGFGEYMIKNFEALACGCVLCAYDQGEEENTALGFVDMKNVVLYKNIDELSQKISFLKEDEHTLSAIAEQGQQLAENRFCYRSIGKAFKLALEAPLRPAQKSRWLDRIKYRFYR